MERKLRGDGYGYKTLCGMDREEKSAVAKRTMGIFRAGEISEGDEVFQCNIESGSEFLAMPFLAIIQVYIIDYAYASDTLDITEWNMVSEYVNRYEEKIKESLDKSMQGNGGKYGLYRTITSEDFCVVMRSAQLQKIYEAVLSLMDVKNKDNQRIFFTYTSIGVECIKTYHNGSRRFCRLGRDTVENNADVWFTIRFRIEKRVLNELQKLKKEYPEKVNLEMVNGLFGRYDLVVRMNVNEFVEFYPYLCQNVAGHELMSNDVEVLESGIVKTIVDGMENRNIQTVTARVLMNMDREWEDSEIEPWFSDIRLNRIKERRQRIEYLNRQFEERHAYAFLLEKQRYLELKNTLKSIMNAYDNLAYEIDTHINWCMCNRYLEILFQNMDDFMRMSKGNRLARDRFLKEFNIFVSAFAEYVKLLQGMNQNTIQAPSYDIVSIVDGQKFLISHGEFIDGIHNDYCQFEWDGDDLKKERVCKEKRRRAKTLIYPDISIKNIEMTKVFEHDTVIRCGTSTDSGKSTPALLICQMPIFEYFARTYDLVPLLSHEICHHMLILEREERNDFLLTQIFSKIAMYICRSVQRFYDNEYFACVDSVTVMIEAQIGKLLKEDYMCEYKVEWKNFIFEHISKSVKLYLENMLKKEEEGQGVASNYLSKEKLLERLEKLVYTVCSDDQDEIITMLRAWQDMSERYDKLMFWTPEWKKFDKLLENIIETLFIRINEITIKSDQPMKMENLYGKKYQEIDEVLMVFYQKSCRENYIQRQCLKNYLELIKETYVLYDDLSCYSFVSDRKIALDKLIIRFAEGVANQLRTAFLQGDRYVVYDQDKIGKTTYWELLAPRRAASHYKEALKCIEIGRIEETIRSVIVWYRESCADIIMSRLLGFDSFGYMRMAVTFGLRMEGYSEKYDLQNNRIIAVLAVLLLEVDGAKSEKLKNGYWRIDTHFLWEKIKLYIDSEINFAKGRIKKNLEEKYQEFICQGDIERICDDFFSIFRKQIEEAQMNIQQGKAIMWKKGIWDEICKEESKYFQNPRSLECFRKEINIYRRLFEMLSTYGKIQDLGWLKIEEATLEHMICIYQNARFRGNMHPIVEKVAEFYRNPRSGKTTNAEKMRDMLWFVQDYYYYNRFKETKEER